jgi:hypothetical protein
MRVPARQAYGDAPGIGRSVLHLWQLRAVAYSNPGVESAIQAVREQRAGEFVPAEHVIPRWADRQ